MPPLDFPNAPTLNQSYTGPNNTVWSWDGAKWLPASLSGTGYAPTLSPVFTGNPTAPTPPGGDNDTSVATTAFVAPAFNNAGRNLLHNPLFTVAQRGVGPWSVPGFTMDRWAMYFTNGTTATYQIALADAHRAVIGDESATNCTQHVVAGSATGGSVSNFYQNIERVPRLAGKTVTASFWAQASAALKLGVGMSQNFGTGGSPSATVTLPGQSVTLTATFARYSVTFNVPSMAGKTIGTAGNDLTALAFYFSGSADQNTNSGSVGVQSGTFYLWGVQLEVGSVATPLEKPDPQQDLAKCQRFYQVGQLAVAGYNASGVQPIYWSSLLPTQMRAQPTITVTPVNTVNCGSFSGAAYPTNGILLMAATTGAGSYTAGATFTASADL